MAQSNVIFAAIFIAYLVFITMRGELPMYAGLLLKSAPAQSAPPQAGQGVGNAIGSAAGMAILGF